MSCASSSCLINTYFDTKVGLDICPLEPWVIPMFEIKREFDKHHSSLFVLHEYKYMSFNYRSLQTTRRDLVKRESIPWYLIQGMKGFWQVNWFSVVNFFESPILTFTLTFWHYLNFLVGSSVIDSWPLTRAVQDTMQVPHTHDRPISQVVLNRELNQVITMCTESHIKVLSQKSQRKNHSKIWLLKKSL